MPEQTPKRGLSAKARGKRCAICGYRTIPNNRLVAYGQTGRILSTICRVCLDQLLGG